MEVEDEEERVSQITQDLLANFITEDDEMGMLHILHASPVIRNIHC